MIGGVHSVLAFGAGEGTSAQDLAAFSANGTVPTSDLDQAPLYEGLEQAWPGFTAAGRCIAFATHDVAETTPVAPTSPSAPATVTLHALDSVHGPISSFATVHGVPVALAVAAATRGHEDQSYLAFMRLAENVPTSPQSFVAAMRVYTGSEN